MSYNRKQLFQERLAKEDIRLLLECVRIAIRNEMPQDTTTTRIQILIGKLKRMEKQ